MDESLTLPRISGGRLKMKKAYEAPAVNVQEFELECMTSICVSGATESLIPVDPTRTLMAGVPVILIVDDTTGGP
jgi:hypothetical protein